MPVQHPMIFKQRTSVQRT